ncbi:MAG: hypothetical protein EHM35_20780 [Planctomycetaceae bacterium]|nr:MAG: hypothetical protein EHM35_20780 [Planctomycetaceae bacterium]
MTVRHEGEKGWSHEHLILPCCAGDEGRPLGIGLQGQVSNHPKLRGSRALVVSVRAQGRQTPVRCGPGRRT